jgi:hypothetical protein
LGWLFGKEGRKEGEKEMEEINEGRKKQVKKE